MLKFTFPTHLIMDFLCRNEKVCLPLQGGRAPSRFFTPHSDSNDTLLKQIHFLTKH